MQAEQLKYYEQVIDQLPNIERKGKTMPYTSLNGHMFSFLDKEGKMGLRLSESDRQDFIKFYKSQLMQQHGRTMKEYVVVPDKMVQETDLLLDYFKKSVHYVSGLKPKASKKKK